MDDLIARDYFTDSSILRDPYAFFDAIRAHGAISRPPGRDYLIVTGFEEANAILRNSDDFSSIISIQGAGRKLPFEPSGTDINDAIQAHREEFYSSDSLVAYDDQQHTFSRSVLMRLFTPSRLRANEQFMSEYADELVQDMVGRGEIEVMREMAIPFVTLVIADLLGVPPQDRQLFMDWIEAAPPPGSLDAANMLPENSPLKKMEDYFAAYVAARRREPRNDIISELANATYPDGTVPDFDEVVRLTSVLFGAGQDTSAKLIGNCLRFIVDEPGLQEQLRADRKLLAPFIEEVLRLEGSSKMTSRLVRRDIRVGDYDLLAGSKLLIALAGANRDPLRWDQPNEMQIGRRKGNEHLSFGRGAHTCAGAPLARAEVKVILGKLLDYTSDIALDEDVHGKPGQRDLRYEESFIVRGLSSLRLKLTPVT